MMKLEPPLSLIEVNSFFELSNSILQESLKKAALTLVSIFLFFSDKAFSLNIGLVKLTWNDTVIVELSVSTGAEHIVKNCLL